MQGLLRLGWFLVLALAPAGLWGANTQARLLLSADQVKPGETVLADIHLQMNPGWHIYWHNSGDSGGATEISWNLPSGVKAGEIQWPPPEKLDEEGLVTYGYHDEVVLLVPLKIAEDAPVGPLKIAAHLAWLECEKICIPGSADVQTTLTIGRERIASPEVDLLKIWQEKLPKGDPPGEVSARWSAAADETRTLVIQWRTAELAVDFFPHAYDALEISGATDVRRVDGTVELQKSVRLFESAAGWPDEIRGLLMVNPNAPEAIGYEVTLPIDPQIAAPLSDVVQRSFLLMLLAAFIGGLILNIMPCVLPVVSLKVLGLVNQGNQAPGEARKHGMVYTVGVLASFLVLAGIVVAMQRAGQLASWGMHFQSPQFLIFMTVLLVLVALNLFGVFQVNVGGKAMGTASALAGKEGTAGAFFHGILITLLSTPCTAPFLGVALGFAFAQPAPVVVIMFLMIGLGLASPYLLLSFQPQWARFLPKPGPWMERFKIAMGFPILGTAVWLFSLTLNHFGEGGVLWLGLFLVILALAAWIYGEFVQRQHGRRVLAMIASAALVVGGFVYALEVELQWRSPVRAASEGIEWRVWNPQAVEAARAAGHPVLVDFTAKWCVNCLVNKRTSIEIPEVRNKLRELEAVAFIGDYTGKDPAIAEELRRHGRAGVPLVLVYAPNTDAPPQILPEILTPGIVLNALEKAAH
jgi:thiol:disulfide interchange protein